MVFFEPPPSPDDESPDRDSPPAPAPPPPSAPSSSSSCLIMHSPHLLDLPPPPPPVDGSTPHTIASLPREPEFARRAPSAASIPVRNAPSRYRSLFDLSGSPRCPTNHAHGRELGGKSSVLALQVPASSLPPPLTASAVVDSFQMSASAAFFPSLQSGEQRLLDPLPNITDSMRYLRCEPLEASNVGSSSGEGNHANSEERRRNSCTRGPGEIVRRLSEVLQGRGDEDLVLQPADRDGMMLQWLQALDLQIVGACRADERLRPMLRWNVSCSGADGRLLAHLSQHFKAKELGLLARCLCVPLVTIRVGKVQCQGRLLCPTALRGYLSLTMLPSSEMRLSFVGDNGTVERIAAFSSTTEDPNVVLEKLVPDSSGRSFVLKLPGDRHAYFWQSEKSKATGDELLSEMKDLLRRRPTLPQLTGIQESRLDVFVSQLRNALAAATSPCFQHSSTSSSTLTVSASITDTSSVGPSSTVGPSVAPDFLRQSQRSCWSRTSPARLANQQSPVHGRAHSGNQGSLSPRASGFKEGAIRGVANVRSIISSREKHRRRVDSSNPASPLNRNVHGIADLDGMSCQPPISPHVALSISSEDRDDTGTHSAGLYTSLQPVSDSHGFLREIDLPFPKQIFSIPLGSSNCPGSPNLLPSLLGGPPVSSRLSVSTSTILAPYYCPCPLRSSALQYTITPPFLRSASEVSAIPSSAPFFSVKPSSAFISQTTLSLDRVCVSPIPLPVSSLVNVPTPLQASSLPPFFSDPIVHIPVIDFQSTTQSFLVTAPPSIASSGISPVLPSFLTSILPRAEGLSDGLELPPLSIFQGLGFSSYNLEDCHRDDNDVQPLLIDSRFRALLASSPQGRPAKDDAQQNADTSWCGRLESSRSPVYDALPQHSGPLLGMVPAILTSGSLSCVLNFCQERGTNATTWVSGSRGLYGGICEAGIPASSITSGNLTRNANAREALACETSEGDSISTDLVDVLLGGTSEDDVKDEAPKECFEQ